MGPMLCAYELERRREQLMLASYVQHNPSVRSGRLHKEVQAAGAGCRWKQQQKAKWCRCCRPLHQLPSTCAQERAAATCYRLASAVRARCFVIVRSRRGQQSAANHTLLQPPPSQRARKPLQQRRRRASQLVGIGGPQSGLGA